jgi:DNA-directed RNA polymerase specialized sigma24 family protein
MEYNQKPQMLTQTAPEDLFILMAYKDENPEQADLAFLEFFKRYEHFLRWAIHEICFNFELYTSEIEEVLFDNTINQVYKKANKFIKVSEETDPAYKERRIKGWLSKIAENELKQIIRKGEHDCIYFNKLEYDESEIFIFDDSPAVSRLTAEELQWFREGLAMLTKQQRFVIDQIYLQKSDRKHLESEILENLAIQLKITKDSVRQIHYRATQIIKQHINNSKLKNYEQFRRPPNNERRNL